MRRARSSSAMKDRRWILGGTTAPEPPTLARQKWPISAASSSKAIRQSMARKKKAPGGRIRTTPGASRARADYMPNDGNATRFSRPRKLDRKGRATGPIRKQHRLHIGPPKETCWTWRTAEMLESPAFRLLSINSRRCLDRLEFEHLAHGLQENGQLIVTYEDFLAWGVSCNYVAASLEELEVFGLIRRLHGRGGWGAPHPTRYRLTYTGDCEGGPATNEWKAITAEGVKRWREWRKAQKNPHPPKW